MIAVIHTQVYENYATAEQPYWKAKGGEEIKITDLPYRLDHQLILELAQLAFEEDNDQYRVDIIDISIEKDLYLSSFEQSQLEYDGSITYPERSVRYADILRPYHIQQQAEQF